MSPEQAAPPPQAHSSAPPGTQGRAGPSEWGEITAFADAIRALHHQENRGALAALRRMDTSRATEPAFHRILAVAAPDASHARAKRLALLARILALATSAEMLGKGPQGLGEALRVADVSEARVQMLMTARGETLDDLLLRTARRLVRDGSLPYQDIGKLILGGPKAVEITRFRIAKDYWARRNPAAGDETPLAESDTLSGDDE